MVVEDVERRLEKLAAAVCVVSVVFRQCGFLPRLYSLMSPRRF